VSQFLADRNLMVGMLGLQLGLFSEAQLMAAMRMWSFQKTRSIEELLREAGELTEQQQAFLRDTAQQYLALHAGNATEGLSCMSLRPSLQAGLQGLGDEELGRTLKIVQEDPSLHEESTDGPVGRTASFIPSMKTKQQRYQVLREFKKGALGKVSVALDTELHREVALKEMQSRYVSDADARSRFMLEAEITGRLEHPGIVPVYSLGLTEAGDPFYTMRFIKGESLKQAIGHLYSSRDSIPRKEFLLALRQLVQCLVDVCNAVGYAHSRGVLHRDLKPDNVMLGKYGETLVVDWGLAKTGKQPDKPSSVESVLISLSGDSNPETQMGSFFGTPEYASPEQADGRLDTLGPASDVYSLGATLYSILTGQAPIPNLPLAEKLQRVRTGNFSPPRLINPDASRALEAICLKAMSLNPGDRYSSAASMASELELWLAGEPVSAYAEPVLDRVSRLARRHRTAFATVFGVLVTGLIGLLVLNSITQTQNRLLTTARDEARAQSVKAMESLKIGRSLAITLLETSEKQLSNTEFDKDQAWKLRNSLMEEAQKEFQKIFLLNPTNREIGSEYARVLRVASNLKRFGGDYEAGGALLGESLNLQLKIPASSRSIEDTIMLAETYRDLGTTAKSNGELSKSSSALQSSIDLIGALISVEKTNIDFQRLMATSNLEIAGLLEELDAIENAASAAGTCVNIYQSLRRTNQLTEADLAPLLFGLARQIRLMHLLERREEAEQLATAHISLGRQILEQHPNDPNLILPFSRILYWSVAGQIEAGDLTAIDHQRLTEAIALSEPLVDSDPSGRYRRNLGEAYLVYGRLLRCQGSLEQAESALAKAEQPFQQLLVQQRSANNLDALGRILRERSLLKRDQGDSDASAKLIAKAVQLQTEAVELSKESIQLKKHLEQSKRVPMTFENR
jgi:eukaryotic-like serine/threonine-protein kinase